MVKTAASNGTSKKNWGGAGCDDRAMLTQSRKGRWLGVRSVREGVRVDWYEYLMCELDLGGWCGKREGIVQSRGTVVVCCEILPYFA